MESTREVQKRIYQNKVNHGFNVTDVNLEFCLMMGEVGEAHKAWREKDAGLGSELADVAIYLLGIAEISGIDLGEEIEKKMQINARRVYKQVDGQWIKAEKQE
ncbi:MAG: hypothetical protein SOR74_02660 [Candidatus Faecivicinus sp.]|nr:hypothetical protein [Candidatus Faecivicinus sp.]